MKKPPETPIELTTAEQEAIHAGLKAANEGDFASDDDVQAIFNKYLQNPPSEDRVPNAETIAAFEESAQTMKDGTLQKFDTVEAMMEELTKDD